MVLEKILMGVISSLIQSIGIVVLIFNLISSNDRKNKFKFFCVMFLYGIIGFFFVPNQFRFLLFVSIIAILMYLFLKIQDVRIILMSFASTIIFAFSEIIISILLVSIGIDSNELVNNISYNLLANILISLVAISFSYIKYIKLIINKINDLLLKNKIMIRYLSILLVLVYLIALKNGLNFELKTNYYVNIFIILSLIFILNIIMKNELKSEQLKEEYQQMLNYVSKYEKIITDQGKANHEFKNQLMVIRGYAQMNSPKLIEYIDSITEDTKKTQSSYMISQLNKFPDGGIKGLLYYKLATMSEENISYDLQVEPGVKLKLSKLSVVMYKNITKILGVLLDNAIDASKKSKLKNIVISVEKDNKNVIFTIQNSYKGKIELSKFGTGYTTKGNKHGYGLKLVKDIIEESKQFDIEKSCDKEYFYTRLIIKINNKKRKSNK